MKMNFVDSVAIQDMRTTENGALVAMVPTARTGIQDYAGYEMGRPDMAKVRVYRSPDEVFDDRAMHSAAHKPITITHPKDGVSAINWSKLSKGVTGAEIVPDRDAGLLYVPMMIADQEGINAATTDHREVSWGYTCDIDWTPGVTSDGQEFDCQQKSIRMNHLALVPRGRAGYACRVGDSWSPIDANKEPVVGTKTITYDGLPVEVTDAAEAVINKLTAARDSLKSELDTANREVGTLTADKATLEGKVTALEASLADAKVTPEKLAKLVADRAALVEDAKRVSAETAYDGLDDDGIRLAAVKAKLGDKAPTDPARVAGAFDALLAQVSATDGFRETVKNGTVANDTIDIEADRAARKAALSNAWKGAN